jgi:hypothetical protein
MDAGSSSDEEADDSFMENLTSDNYLIWSIRMRSLLILRGCWQSVTGEDPDTQKGAMAKLTILCWLGDLWRVAERHETAKEIWDALEKGHKAHCRSFRFIYRRDLCRLQMREMESVMEYVHRARDLSCHLDDAGMPVPEEELAIHVLQGLREEFSTDVMFLQHRDDVHTLDTLLPRLRMAESFAASDRREAERQEAERCSTAEHGGDRPGNPTRAGRRSRRRTGCWHCGDVGHTKAQCGLGRRGA